MSLNGNRGSSILRTVIHLWFHCDSPVIHGLLFRSCTRSADSALVVVRADWGFAIIQGSSFYYSPTGHCTLQSDVLPYSPTDVNFIESSSQIIRPNLTAVRVSFFPESLHIVQSRANNVHCHHVKTQRGVVIIGQFIVHSKLTISNPVFSTIKILIYSSTNGFIPF